MDYYLRLATVADMDLLYEWANEIVVRKNSFSTEEILYEEHKKWFEKLMEDQNCRQYIYMYNDEEMGQVRFTVYGETAEISYSICAERRGQGHGKRILELSCEQVKKDFPEVLKLIGKVKPDNAVSRKAFTGAGFREEYITYIMDMSEFIPNKELPA